MWSADRAVRLVKSWLVRAVRHTQSSRHRRRRPIGGTVYDRCEVCGDMILCDVFRDVYHDVSHNMHTAEYLGICGVRCPSLEVALTGRCPAVAAD